MPVLRADGIYLWKKSGHQTLETENKGIRFLIIEMKNSLIKVLTGPRHREMKCSLMRFRKLGSRIYGFPKSNLCPLVGFWMVDTLPGKRIQWRNDNENTPTWKMQGMGGVSGTTWELRAYLRVPKLFGRRGVENSYWHVFIIINRSEQKKNVVSSTWDINSKWQHIYWVNYSINS